MSETSADLSKEAATQLFERLYPEPYAIWRQGCPGLLFDPETFWSAWTVHEIESLNLVGLRDDVTITPPPQNRAH
jgi:hypothetical protein